MLISLKRKRIAAERQAAVNFREQAARDFVAAIREAEAALEALKAANDKFYLSDDQRVQSCLNDLRQSRERLFAFHLAKEVAAEAPRLTRALGFRVAPTVAMPFLDFIAHTSKLDLGAAGDVTSKEA